MKTMLLIIDPQNDFCNPKGTLYVPGADMDMQKLSAFINVYQNKIDSIWCSRDDHPAFHISSPMFYKEKVEPFVTITAKDIKNGKYTSLIPDYQKWLEFYSTMLKTTGKDPITIWPYHCLNSTWGSLIHLEIVKALSDWSFTNKRMSHWIIKGSSWNTEHYSAYAPEYCSFAINLKLANAVAETNVVYIAGEALSHCVIKTLEDVAIRIYRNDIDKFVLLEDCTSVVPGFEEKTTKSLDRLKKLGMRICKSTDI